MSIEWSKTPIITHLTYIKSLANDSNDTNMKVEACRGGNKLFLQ